MNQFPATTCSECGTIYGHQKSVCRECRSDQMECQLISGHGTVYATTTIRVPSAEFQGEEPYEVCVVDVGQDESVRVTARLTDNEKPRLGDEVEFVEQQDGIFHFETNG